MPGKSIVWMENNEYRGSTWEPIIISRVNRKTEDGNIEENARRISRMTEKKKNDQGDI